MTQIDFPDTVNVTPCKTATQTYIEHTRHGVVRHVLTVAVVPFIVGQMPSTGRTFPMSSPDDRSDDRFIAPACGPNCPNVWWKL